MNLEDYAEAWETVEGRILDEMNQEYEREFGEKYRAERPFKPDWALVYALVESELGEISK